MKKSFKIAFIFFITFSLGCKKEKNRICVLYSKPVGYSIGSIVELKKSFGKTLYIFDYDVNGNILKGEERAYGIGQKDETLIGKKFIVVFEIDNPNNSDLNLDYTIENELDFKEFIDKYDKSPPSPDFPTKCK